MTIESQFRGRPWPDYDLLQGHGAGVMRAGELEAHDATLDATPRKRRGFEIVDETTDRPPRSRHQALKLCQGGG
jgi:hypothetical protein